jgi:tRNA(Ile)-lysidine synthase
MAREIGAAGVVTAHTQDDAAETLLLALLRGRPLEGLAGIRERRADGVFRPMLGVSRRSVLAYLRSRGVPHRRDSSNADLSFDRNWLRKKVVPLLSRRFGRGVSANLAASAESLARDWEWLTEVFQSGAGASLETVAGAAAIPRATIARMPPAAVRRALLAMARAVGGERFAPTRRELLALQRLVEGGSDFRFQAGRRVEFLARRDRLRAFAVTKKAR